MRKRHRIIGLGGTFDHFHAGHKKLILFAAELADKILIGVTQENMTQHKLFAAQIELYNQRVRQVKQFCRSHNLTAIITPLEDPFGPTLENSVVEALAVTPETLIGGNKINELRGKLGLRELPIYICDFYLSENGQALHADQIRAGRFNRQGQDLYRLFTQDLILSDSQRQFFQTPQGELLEAPHSETQIPLVAVVGDYCLEHFIKQDWPYNIGIFDFKQQRQTITSPILEKIAVTAIVSNPPGVITKALADTLQSYLKKQKCHLQVAGEEDLAAVALVLLAPLGTHVFYGQPNQGMVCMIVTEELKQRFFEVLQSS